MAARSEAGMYGFLSHAGWGPGPPSSFHFRHFRYPCGHGLLQNMLIFSRYQSAVSTVLIILRMKCVRIFSCTQTGAFLLKKR